MTKGKFKRGMVTLCTLVLVFFCAVTAHAADDYPLRYKNAERDAFYDDYNFWNRECTSFVAWCLNSRNGVDFKCQYRGAVFGHAKTWGYAARSIGIAVDNSPAVGSVAWSDKGRFGHVAWVSAVNGDKVTIEEYNYRTEGVYNSQEVNKDEFTGYIHIKDIPDPYSLIKTLPCYVGKTDVTNWLAGHTVMLYSKETAQCVCGGESNSTVHGNCYEYHDTLTSNGWVRTAEPGHPQGVYKVTLTSDGWAGFQLPDGKWLSAQGGDYLTTEATDLYSWECFRVYFYEDNLYLLSQKNDCYVQVTNERDRPLKACRKSSDGLEGATWERFDILIVD